MNADGSNPASLNNNLAFDDTLLGARASLALR